MPRPGPRWRRTIPRPVHATSAFLGLDGKRRASPDSALPTLPTSTCGDGGKDADQDPARARFGTGVSYALAGVGNAPYVRYDGTGANPDQSVRSTISRPKTVRATSGEYGRRIASELHIRERQGMGCVMVNVEGERWSDNAGVHSEQTCISAATPMPIPAGVCAHAAPRQGTIPCAAYPDAVTTADDLQPVCDDALLNPLTGNTHDVARTHRRANNRLSQRERALPADAGPDRALRRAARSNARTITCPAPVSACRSATRGAVA